LDRKLSESFSFCTVEQSSTPSPVPYRFEKIPWSGMPERQSHFTLPVDPCYSGRCLTFRSLNLPGRIFFDQ
jgi:hypothetical protein